VRIVNLVPLPDPAGDQVTFTNEPDNNWPPPDHPGGPAPDWPAPSHPQPSAAPPPPPPPIWPPPDSTVLAENLSKTFRGGLVAVSDVTFAIGPGVTALLGPNGAGKSTLIRLLAGLARPSLGHVSILGGDPRHSPEARRQIGLVPQQDGVFELDSAAEVVELAAVLNGLDEPKLRAAQALEMVELDPDMDRPVGTFSKGMRQRVKIAQAIVHDPAILMLDEPLNGLDPRQRREMIGLFHHLGDSGKTVLVSSHVLDEVERFGSHVLVVTKGRLAAQGDFRAIRELLDNYPMRVRIRSAQARAVAASLVASGALSGCTVNDENEVEITTDEAAQFRRELVTTARHLGARLEEVTPVDDDLESVFRYLVGGPSS